MSTEGEVMDASGAPVTDELTGVLHSPQRETLFMRRKRQPDAEAPGATGPLDA